MADDYQAFLAGKQRATPDAGWPCEPIELGDHLAPFQRTITAWAVRKGRAAIWADTGLGKTRMQCEWARQVVEHTGRGVLILAPLAVAEQTVREAASVGIEVAYAKDQASVVERITITNYDRLHLFDASQFAGVVLDESSILKAFSGTTKKTLVEMFAATPYRLACTATPAPNDIEELCNHADFLGVMKPAEMRSTFFIADNRGSFMKYRLKGHAKDAFFGWLASWAIACRTPADLGFDDTGYVLPALTISPRFVPTSWSPDGQLFATGLQGVTERATVRRETLDARVAAVVEIANGPAGIHAPVDSTSAGDKLVIWCGLNDEQDRLARLLGDRCVSVDGRTPHDLKVERERQWREGSVPILITKAAVFGWGMNWQHCAQMIFCGISDSYESYYQCIRRCWRFGQQRPVTAHVVLADVERPIYDNVLDKERTARAITGGLVAAVAERNRSDLFAGTSRGDSYEPSRPLTLPSWLEAS